MTYWIIPANLNRYRLADVLNDMHFVDWRQHNNFEIGDIVFIYISRPQSQIIYKMEVVDINLTSNVTAADRKYWVDYGDFDVSIRHNRFFRMKPLSQNLSDKLTLEDLLQHGLKGTPQGALKVKDALLNYIQSVL